jgi:outer membrane protein assembly factor BamB
MIRSRSLFALLVAPLLALSSSPLQAQVAPVDWRQFHGHQSHRGFNRFERVVGEDNVFNLSLSWIGNGATFGADLVFKSSPTVVDGFVYFGTDQGQLLAFRDTCGSSECRPAWSVDLPEAIYNTPAVVNGVLYVGTASPLGNLYAFDVDACAAGSCEPLWTSNVGIGESSPTVAGGTVYVGSQFNGVYAFDASGCGAATCDPLWVGETGGYVINSPAVVNGVVYAGSEDHRLYAFDADGCGAATCDPLWTGPVSGPIYSSSPAVSNGVVFVASFNAAPNSFLYAFDAEGCGAATCAPLWKGTGGHYLNSSPAVAYGRVYIGSGDGTMLVYRAAGCGQASCPTAWIGQPSSLGATMESSPMVANGVVYVGENNSRIYAFPARGCGGRFCGELWQFITQDPLVNSSPALVNGTLYVTGTNFSSVPELYVFELVG